MLLMYFALLNVHNSDGVDDNEELAPSMPHATSPAAATATNDPHPSEDETSGKSSEEDSNFYGGKNDQDDNDNEYEEDDTSNDQTVEFHDAEEDEEDDESRFNQDQTAPNTTAVHQESNQENDEDDVSDLEDEFNGAAVSSNLKESDGRAAVAAGNQAMATVNELENLKAELTSKNEAEAALRAELEAKSHELESYQDELHRLLCENEDRKRRIDDLLDTVRSLSNLNSQITSMLYNGNGAISNSEE